MRNFLLVLVLLATASFTFADPECRGGTINWFTSPHPADFNLVTFVVSNTWRASSFNANPSIGSQLSTNLVFQFGDGNSVGLTGMTVTSLDLYQDVLSTTWNVTYRYSTLSLPTSFNAYILLGTRSTVGLRNNFGKLANLGANVVLTGSLVRSPILQSLCSFRVAASSKLQVQLFSTNSSNVVVYAKATTALQLGGPLAVTGKLEYLVPSQFSISSSGLLTFDASSLGLSALGFYQIQILATDSNGITVPLDVLIQVYAKGTCGLCLLNPLALGSPCASDSDCCGKGSCTFTASNVTFVNPSPIPGTIIKASTFSAVSIDVTAKDLLGLTSSVLVYASSLPIGASLDVVAAVDGRFRFNWIPLISGDFQVCFGARQTFGLSLLGSKPASESIQGQICVGITVTNPPCGRGTLNSSLSFCTDRDVVDQLLCCLCPSSSGLDPVLGCAFCLLGRFGLGCQECNNCGPHGKCRGGALGTGTCDCDDGWLGVSPPLSNTPNCNIPRSRTCTSSQVGFVESADYQLGGTLNPKSAAVYVQADPTAFTRLPIRITRPLVSNFDFVFLQDVSATTTYSDLTNLKAAAATFFLTKGILGTNTRVTYGSFSGHPSSFKLFGPLTDNLNTIVGSGGYLSQLAVNVSSTENYVSSYEATAAAAQSEIGWGTDTYKVIFVLTRKPNNPKGMSFDELKPFLFERSAQPAFLYQGTGIIGIVTSVLSTPYQDDLIRAGFGYSAFLNPFQLAWSVNAILAVTLLQPQLFLAGVRDPYDFFKSEKSFWLGLLLNPLLGTELNVKFQWPQNVPYGSIPTQNMAISVLGYGLVPVTIDLNRPPTSNNLRFNLAYGGSVAFRIPAQDADQNSMSVVYLSNISGGTAVSTKGSIVPNLVSSDFTGAFSAGSFYGNAVFSFLITDGCLNSSVYTATFVVAAPPSTLPLPTTTSAPTVAPTEAPTNAPTNAPTEAPTESPTNPPTDAPTSTPSEAPTSAPTVAPTSAPTNAPTDAPTDAPTEAPTDAPEKTTEVPSDAPTSTPTEAPTAGPTDAPTEAPTVAPTNAPTEAPTSAPTEAPTSAPTAAPTNAPTDAPLQHFPPAGEDFGTNGLLGFPVKLSSFLQKVQIAEETSKNDEIFITFTATNVGKLYNSQGDLISLSSPSTPGKRDATSFSIKEGFDFYYKSEEDGVGSIHFQYHTEFDKYSPVYIGTIEISDPAPEGEAPIAKDSQVSLNVDETVEFQLDVSDPVYASSELYITLLNDVQGQLCSDAQLTVCYFQGSYFKNQKLYYRGPSKKYGKDFTSIQFTVTNSLTLVSEKATTVFSIDFVNNPPVATFSLEWIVYQNTVGTFSLSGIDDRTPSNEILFTITNSIAASKGNLSYISASGTFGIVESPFDLPFGGLVLQFTPVYNQYGPNYASFNVTLTDGDGASSLYIITINVKHVNQPPTIFGTLDVAPIYQNQNLTVGFGGEDIDSPFLTAYLSNKPSRGQLYTCVQDQNGNCTAGVPIVADQNGVTIIPSTSSDNFRWLCVFVPAREETRMNYATLSFLLVDDYNARSALYVVTVDVKRVNKAPVLSLDGPYIATVDQSSPLFNNTFNDPDGGDKDEFLSIVSHSINSTISFNSTAPFESKSAKMNPDCVQVSNQVINCTAPQTALKNYLLSLSFVSGEVGNHTVTITVNDMGAGAEPSEKELFALEVSGNVTVTVSESTANIPAKRDLTLAIGLGTVGGAAGAAAAVGLAAKMIKKPSVESFSNMMDFGANGVQDNPLYANNDGDNFNPIFENLNG